MHEFELDTFDICFCYRKKEEYAAELKKQEQLMERREEELERLAQQRKQAQIKRGGLELGSGLFRVTILVCDSSCVHVYHFPSCFSHLACTSKSTIISS